MISVKCACGKRMSVGDALANKVIRCSVCGNEILVSTGKWAGGKVHVGDEKTHNSVYISKGKIVLVSIIAACLVSGVIFYRGPMGVWRDWDAMTPQARTTIQDVVTFGLRAYLSEQGKFDPRHPRFAPTLEPTDIIFTSPAMAMSMPEKVAFGGRSNQGPFLGTYNTRTGEVEGDIYYGGVSSSGLVDLVKATGKFHITGRDTNGQVSAESDGQKLELVYPPTLGE